MEKDFSKQMGPENKKEELYSYKSRFQSRITQKTQKSHFILIRGTIHQEVIAIVNIYIYL
jgi:hypothetical protein